MPVACWPVRLLLPPSEGKTPGGRGRPLGTRLASEPGDPRTQPRLQIVDALEHLLAGPRDVAAAALLLPPAAVDEALAANGRVLTSGTVPALRRYAGVVYDGLDAPNLSPGAARAAARSVLVFSGLLGVVRGNEPVPYYRVPAKAVLPGIGVVGTFWRPVLDDVLPSLLDKQLVVDLRSSDYAAMWRPDRELARRVVTVRVLSPLPDGSLGVVSYPSKFAKGRLAAALLEKSTAGLEIRTAEDVAAVWRETTGLPADVQGAQVRIHTA